MLKGVFCMKHPETASFRLVIWFYGMSALVGVFYAEYRWTIIISKYTCIYPPPWHEQDGMQYRINFLVKFNRFEFRVFLLLD